jgi:hypothetical protein
VSNADEVLAASTQVFVGGAQQLVRLGVGIDVIKESMVVTLMQMAISTGSKDPVEAVIALAKAAREKHSDEFAGGEQEES